MNESPVAQITQSLFGQCREQTRNILGGNRVGIATDKTRNGDVAAHFRNQPSFVIGVRKELPQRDKCTCAAAGIGDDIGECNLVFADASAINVCRKVVPIADEGDKFGQVLAVGSNGCGGTVLLDAQPI